MKRFLFSLLLLLLSALPVQAQMLLGGMDGGAAGGDGPNVYYYSYGGSASSYTTCDNYPGVNIHAGGLVTVGGAGTATSFGVKLSVGSVYATNVCLYNSTGTTRLGYCTVNTTAGGVQWVECTGQSIAVTATSYLILMVPSNADVAACRCTGGADCAVTDGKYDSDPYNADPAIGCPAAVDKNLGADGGNATGVRIYVD